jgi:hypothetical protein
MRSYIAISIIAFSSSVLAAPTPQTAGVTNLVGSVTGTIGSVTNPSAGSDNLIQGNGNNNGQNNGVGNSAGNNNGNNNEAGTGNSAANGNTFNLKPLGSILDNGKRGVLGGVEGVQVAGPVVGGLTDGKGGLLNGVTVGTTTDSLTNGVPVLPGVVGRGLTDSLDLSKLNQAQLLSLLGQVTGALQGTGATGALKPVTGAAAPVTGATAPVTGAVKPVTGTAGGLTSDLLKRQSNILGGVTGSVTGVVGGLTPTVGSVTGATAGSGNSLLNNGNSNGQGNGVSLSQTTSYSHYLTNITPHRTTTKPVPETATETTQALATLPPTTTTST